MLKLKCYTGIFIFFLAVVLAIPKPEDGKHKIDDTIGNHLNKDHDIQDDHEAFLGKEEAKTFDQLTPEESRRRLLIIVDKIDTNKNGMVDMTELKEWIKLTQNNYIEDDVTKQWKQHNVDGNETLHWEVYRKNIYGFMDELDPVDLESEDTGVSYKSMLARDRRRWSVADKNYDDELSKQEFTAFLHPEEVPSMRDVVLSETIEDIDKNNDGKVSIDEYIGDIYKSSDSIDDEPEWVSNEREVFTQYRDLDKDGYLNRDEVREWITPKNYDHAEAEAKHLVYEADKDSNAELSKEEILDKYDLFVGSQATDYGEALTRHDEF